MKQFFKNRKQEVEDLLFKLSDERIELAKDRLAVHQLYLENKCQFDPYLHKDSAWYKHVPPR